MNALAFINLGGPEMIWVFVLALLLFGAKKLPSLARGIGQSMGEFKKARDEFERELHLAELDAEKEEIKKAIKPPKERRLEVSTAPAKTPEKDSTPSAEKEASTPSDTDSNSAPASS